MKKYTLANLFKDNYALSDIDALVHVGLAQFSSQNGNTTVTIEDKVVADNYIFELNNY